jgi:hypothetical protein
MDFGMMIEMAGVQKDPLDRQLEDSCFRSASIERWYNLHLSSPMKLTRLNTYSETHHHPDSRRSHSIRTSAIQDQRVSRKIQYFSFY